MTGVKWAGILTGTLTFALIGLANVLVASMTRHTVPPVVNEFGAAIGAAGIMIAFVAYLHDLTSRKVDRISELFAARMEDLEARVGDHNTGFVEGYLASQGREAVAPSRDAVTSITQHYLSRRGAHDG
jgi:hypothetical protein